MGEEQMEDSEAGEVLNSVIQSLGKLSPESRQRVIKAVLSFYSLQGLPNDGSAQGSAPMSTISTVTQRPDFSSGPVISPKQFLLQKQPKTDVERMACLAYYLTHYRETPHFKTLDLAKLNTEAAQSKFSNAAYAANNATISGYLTVAPGGSKQLSASGEQFVQALPDRDAARATMSKVRVRKTSKANRKRQK